MKCSFPALVVALSTIAITQPTHAAEMGASPSNANNRQASVLAIQPATIARNADNVIYSTNQLDRIAASIPAQHARESPSIKPGDFFKSPGAALKRFFQEQPDEKPQPIDPVGFFKVDPLDSGVSVKVAHF